MSDLAGEGAGWPEDRVIPSERAVGSRSLVRDFLTLTSGDQFRLWAEFSGREPNTYVEFYGSSTHGSSTHQDTMIALFQHIRASGRLNQFALALCQVNGESAQAYQYVIREGL